MLEDISNTDFFVLPAYLITLSFFTFELDRHFVELELREVAAATRFRKIRAPNFYPVFHILPCKHQNTHDQ